MASLGEQHLIQAIHGEIAAREVYSTLSARIEIADGAKMMNRLAAEEEGHRIALAARYKSLFGKDYEFNPDLKAGPDYSFLKNSVFGYTQALEALKLALGAETDAAAFYSDLLAGATDKTDIRMLRSLIRFERRHAKKLEKQIHKLEETNHWDLH